MLRGRHCASVALASPSGSRHFQVLECSWDELWNKVQQAQDLDHIIAAHEAFLDTVISRCLLDADSRVRRERTVSRSFPRARPPVPPQPWWSGRACC